jgi:hypothetical protein
LDLKVLITLMGRSTWALVNSVWASARSFSFVPDRVHILAGGCDRDRAETAAKMLRQLLTEHGSPAEVRLELVDDQDARNVAETVRRIAAEEKRSGSKLALDVTSGKKLMVVGSLLSSLTKNDFDHIFYLQVESRKNTDRPYLEIPLEIQNCHDILAESKTMRPPERGVS